MTPDIAIIGGGVIGSATAADLLRQLPQVQRVLEHPGAAPLAATFGRKALTEAIRHQLDKLRLGLREGHVSSSTSAQTILASVADGLAARRIPHLRRVINATGIVLHTNLGRAPLAAEAIAAVAEVAGHYANLEFDLDTGVRGSRTSGVEALLCELTGAEAALAVNNGAAAILLALAALGAGGEVIVSRGELVEIGGGFRIPDVIRQGGASLVEVGATNKTRPSDYAAAIGERTRVLLKVHQSNFRIVGFTADTSIEELAALASASGSKVVADVGSGLLQTTPGIAEPTLREAIAAGADLVTCSGDKLLGGPQAGLILGSKAAMAPLRKHPLMRAFRLDKMSLAALEATLRLHRDTPERVPVRRMLLQDPEQIKARANRLIDKVGHGDVVPTQAFAGGGALPDERMPSWAVALATPHGAATMAQRLRNGVPAVVGRSHDGKLLLDMMTVTDDELSALAECIETSWSERDGPGSDCPAAD